MKQANIQLSAPGFLGVNTEDAPTALPEGWAAIGGRSAHCADQTDGR